jgi:putative ABC transport system permease protein
MAPPEVLDVFSFPLLQGDARTALKRPASVLLTEKTTRFFFGGTNPVGKIITINNDISGLRWRELTVTGVLRDIPRTSSYQFDLLFSPPPRAVRLWQRWIRDTRWRNIHSFILLRHGADLANLKAGLPAFRFATWETR